MEETTVLIVGAGPSGLTLAAMLGRMDVQVVILEKEIEVDEDPRGIVISGDAVRISYQVGIGEALTTKIGTDIGTVYFHSQNFRQAPFMGFDLSQDWHAQAVPNEIVQFQPNYERELRELLKVMPSCQLRVGCEVVSRVEMDDSTIVEYLDRDQVKRSIRTSWLVGADGKRGIVRKKFLEPEGIKQELGLYDYVGTWVAVNLKITVPTPKTHPEFPLWKLGYSSEKVHSIFWPCGFHFCNDPHRPAVSGRFGPKGSLLWRHEFSVEEHDSSEDVLGDFWKQFGPWMKIPGSKFSRSITNSFVEFPRDCIEVLRCRPFRFATQVVNRWFCRKTLLVGDAAHVFPPFGGQGIAAGIRDSQSLAWRLTMMTRLNVSEAVREKVLIGWSQERRFACDAATVLTKHNGSITNERSVIRRFFLQLIMRVIWSIPVCRYWFTKKTFTDRFVYRNLRDGFFLQHAGGGRKIPQIWIRAVHGKPQLSDEILLHDVSRLALLVLVRSGDKMDTSEIGRLLSCGSFPNAIMTVQDVTYLCLDDKFKTLDTEDAQICHVCDVQELLGEGIVPINGYDQRAVRNSFEPNAKYVLLRPDFYVHSVARNLDDLATNLATVRAYFGDES